jgi:membrane protein
MMVDPEPPREANRLQGSAGRTSKWRQRYEESAPQDLVNAPGAIEFGDRIILLGAALLLSVLPLINLLSALASQRVDDDIARPLGLGRQGTRILAGLFRTSNVSFNLGVFVSLLLSFTGTIAVARSVQVIYERTFEQAHTRGNGNLLRCFVASLLRLGCRPRGVAHSRRRDQRTTTNQPAGPVLLGLVDFVHLTLFFWWSIHFLLAGRESWTRVGASAVATAVFWMGLGVFASFYLSSTLVSDSRLYGEIGVVFTLVTWFIAMGAVIMLGAVAGAVWQRRRARHAGSSKRAV